MKEKINVYTIGDSFKRKDEILTFFRENLSEKMKDRYFEIPVTEDEIVEILSHPDIDNDTTVTIILGNIPDIMFLDPECDDAPDGRLDAFLNFVFTSFECMNILDSGNSYKDDEKIIDMRDAHQYDHLESHQPKRYVIFEDEITNVDRCVFFSVFTALSYNGFLNAPEFAKEGADNVDLQLLIKQYLSGNFENAKLREDRPIYSRRFHNWDKKRKICIFSNKNNEDALMLASEFLKKYIDREKVCIEVSSLEEVYSYSNLLDSNAVTIIVGFNIDPDDSTLIRKMDLIAYNSAILLLIPEDTPFSYEKDHDKLIWRMDPKGNSDALRANNSWSFCTNSINAVNCKKFVVSEVGVLGFSNIPKTYDNIIDFLINRKDKTLDIECYLYIIDKFLQDEDMTKCISIQ